MVFKRTHETIASCFVLVIHRSDKLSIKLKDFHRTSKMKDLLNRIAKNSSHTMATQGLGLSSMVGKNKQNCSGWTMQQPSGANPIP